MIVLNEDNQDRQINEELFKMKVVVDAEINIRLDFVLIYGETTHQGFT